MFSCVKNILRSSSCWSCSLPQPPAFEDEIISLEFKKGNNKHSIITGYDNYA